MFTDVVILAGGFSQKTAKKISRQSILNKNQEIVNPFRPLSSRFRQIICNHFSVYLIAYKFHNSHNHFFNLVR